MKIFTAKPLDKSKYILGEGPVFDPRYGRLSWVDIKDGRLYTADLVYSNSKTGSKIDSGLKCEDMADSGKGKATEKEAELESLLCMDNIESVSFGQMVGAALPLAGTDGFIVAATDGLYLWSGKSGIKPYLDLRDIYEPYQRSNDAKADPMGRMFFGSMVYDGLHEDSGNLYRLDNYHSTAKENTLLYKKSGTSSGNTLHQKVLGIAQENTKLSNGMAWNKTADKFYFSDSSEHAVFVYDYDKETGEISGRKKLFEIFDLVPDGMCIDEEDNLWVAVWGGSRVECRSGENGEKLAEIKVAAGNVTSCCFAGESLDKLIITTSGEGQEGEYDGCIFVCDVGVRGVKPDYVKGIE